MGSISAEDRAAIDKAIAEGKVQKIPAGVTAIRFDEPNGWKEQRDRYFGRKPDPTVAVRRERVRAAHAEGKTVKEIVRNVGVSDMVVRMDLIRLGLTINRAYPKPAAEEA